MGHIRRFDHVGLTVLDLEAAIAFFVALGLELDEPPQPVEGDFVSTVVGIEDSRVRVAMLQLPGNPDGGTRLEISTFVQPPTDAVPPPAPPTLPGLRNVCFEVADLHAVVEQVAAAGFGLVGGISEYEGTYRMCYVRGPEGVIVSLAEDISPA